MRHRKCWGLKDAATRCEVLRSVDASKCVCGRGPTGGAYSAPPDPLAGFGEGNREGGMERAREGKGREGKGSENGNWGEFA